MTFYNNGGYRQEPRKKDCPPKTWESIPAVLSIKLNEAERKRVFELVKHLPYYSGKNKDYWRVRPNLSSKFREAFFEVSKKEKVKEF